MITNDPLDNAYANELIRVVNNAGNLTAMEINNAFHDAADKIFPLNQRREPYNLMLREVYDGVMYDDIDPEYRYAYPEEAFNRYSIIIKNYVNGIFYKTTFTLSGNYAHQNEGTTFLIDINHNQFKIVAQEMIRNELTKVCSVYQVTGDMEQDLKAIQRLLPTKINSYMLTYTEVEEHL